jgi:flagellar biosynthesis anti-sigma factor FlgM
MRVNGPVPYSENLQPDKVTNTGSSNPQGQAAPVNATQDQAQFSVDSSRIEQLKASLSGVPEVRQERVNALRQAISQGTYHVTDQQLAGAISDATLIGNGGSTDR